MIGTPTLYQQRAMEVAQVTGNVLTQRPGTDPGAIRQWLLTTTAQGDVWLFAELDDQRIPRFEPYEQAAHHLSSSLRGMPVLISNHTGLRLAFLLSPVRTLPAKVLLPDELRPGRVLLGMRSSGGPVSGTWDQLGHVLVAGITGGGKSVTLRSLVYQALRQECNLILADYDNSTFRALEGHPALLTGLATDQDGFSEALRAARGEIERRKALYSLCPTFPESMSEYNDWARKAFQAPLKRLVVVLDEFNNAVGEMGGLNGELMNNTLQVARRGRKFGITLVISSQEFSKEVIGRVRDQMGVMIVHRMRDAAVAQNVGMASAAKISPNRPGRAITDRWGMLQMYFLDKSRLIQDATVTELMSDAERTIAERAMAETEGIISREILTGWSMGFREAVRLQEDWKLRGWAIKDPQRANALCIAPKLIDLLHNCTTCTTRTTAAQPAQLPAQPAQPTYNDPEGA